MTDVHTPERRSRNMQAIRSANTKPEIKLRKLLFARGLRFRLHVNGLPGKPDIVFPKYRVAVFVHGCFWHGHECYLFKLPKTRTVFWATKIAQNRSRDRRGITALHQAGWRVLIVWECALKGRLSWNPVSLVDHVERWIRVQDAGVPVTEIRHLDAASE